MHYILKLIFDQRGFGPDMHWILMRPLIMMGIYYALLFPHLKRFAAVRLVYIVWMGWPIALSLLIGFGVTLYHKDEPPFPDFITEFIQESYICSYYVAIVAIITLIVRCMII